MECDILEQDSINIHKYWDIAIGLQKVDDLEPSEYLNGDTVIYSDYNEIRTTLDYDMRTEQEINYNSLSKSEIIDKIANFTSRVWQVHPFIEGNTRTTAIFI